MEVRIGDREDLNERWWEEIREEDSIKEN